jgi:cytochrome P450
MKALADGITAHDIAPYFTRSTLDIIYQTSSGINTNAQTGNDDSTWNIITNIVDTTAMKFLKPWLFIDWIFNATELGKKYNKAIQCEHGKIINEMAKKRRTRETTHTRGLNDEKTSLMDILIQYEVNNNVEIVGEIFTIVGGGTETTSNACGYVLALLGDNQHIQERVMQEQQNIFGDDVLRPVRSDDVPRMVYLEQVGSCLLHSSLFSRIIAILLHYIK